MGYKNLLVTVSDDVLKGVKRKITGSISIGFKRRKRVFTVHRLYVMDLE